ncbi:MAG TPA: endonuclease VII domain-containing protein [Candidatus Paceibacterota bacterium]|nr:endonuclease VII domain-containing protein [Candidatus Paceibacterota bacterium]
MVKKCTRCGKTNSDVSFSLKKNSTSVIAKRCDDCRSSAAVTWGARNPEKIRVANERFKASGKARYSRLLKKYNISESLYLELLKKQGGRCAICKHSSPRGRYPVFNVDHDHNTGRIRGLLCGNCNRGLGYLGENLKVLKSAINYVKK